MKSFLVLAAYLVTVSSIPLLDLRDATDEQMLALKKCFVGYNISPDILEIDDDKAVNPINELTGEQQSCIIACLNKHYYKTMRLDGSIDIEKTLEEVPDEKKEEQRKKNENTVKECRETAGPDDCKFIHCIAKKEFLLKS